MAFGSSAFFFYTWSGKLLVFLPRSNKYFADPSEPHLGHASLHNACTYIVLVSVLIGLFMAVSTYHGGSACFFLSSWSVGSH